MLIVAFLAYSLSLISSQYQPFLHVLFYDFDLLTP